MPKGNNLDMRLKRGHIQLILRKKKEGNGDAIPLANKIQQVR